MGIGTVIKKIKAYLPALDEKRLLEAYNFSKKAHEGQKCYDGAPYIIHPVAACEILTKFKVDEDTLITCLLHDIPEDTKYTLLDIEKKFGKKIAFLVEGVTKLSKVHYNHNMAQRQIESLKRLFFHSAKDLRIILVKLADRLHNMRTLDNISSTGKRLRIAKETLEIYAPISNLLGIWEIKSELEDLCFKYIYPQDFEKTKNLVEESALKNTKILQATVRKTKTALKEKKIKAKIHARQKNLYSIFKKMLYTGKTFYDIYDLVALRIVVNDIDDCYRALGAVHQIFRPKHKKVKDHIAVPKVNGYQSIHTTVFGIDGTVTEFQIRTHDMHLESEYGIAAHYFYEATKKTKPGKSKVLPGIFKKHAEWAKKILDIQKEVRTGFDFVESLKFDIFQDRIFAFTPKGDVIDLPYGANVVDFAYHIHSDIGNHAVSAEINGERLPITTRLETGDTVKVITSEKQHGPNRDWLTMVKTGLARTRIKEFFKKEGGDHNYKAGLKLLKKQLALFGKRKLKRTSKPDKQKILAHFGVKTMKDLVTAVGEGNIRVKSVIRQFYSDQDLLGLPARIDKLKQKDRLSKDRINQAMAMILGNEELEERADKSSLKIYRIEVNVEVRDRVGLLRDMAITLSHIGVNIYKIGLASTKKSDIKHIILKIEVYDLRHLERALKAITTIQDVVKVYKSK